MHRVDLAQVHFGLLAYVADLNALDRRTLCASPQKGRPTLKG